MEDIILRAKQGDERAIEQIASDYKGLIRSVTNKFFLVGGEKEDLWQEGMLGLYFAIINFDENKGSFPAFVKLCVTRQIMRAVTASQSAKNKPLSDSVDISLAENVADERSPLEKALEREFITRLTKAVEEQLSPIERQTAMLYAEGYSYEDISKILNKSYKAVDGALQRARKKLTAFKEQE